MRRAELEAVRAVYRYMVSHKQDQARCPWTETARTALRLIIEGEPVQAASHVAFWEGEERRKAEAQP